MIWGPVLSMLLRKSLRNNSVTQVQWIIIAGQISTRSRLPFRSTRWAMEQ